MRRMLLREILWIIFLTVLGTSIGILAIYFFGTPSVQEIAHFPLHQSTRFFDRTGTTELYRLYDEENRLVIAHDAIPDTIRLATIASEDAHFYAHQGIDILAILRALIVDVKSGEIKQGGSTITQQLARSLYLTRERTLQRKIRELFLAVKIENHLSKDDILDFYLNTVPYGSNAYGIETASETFFGKKATDLTLEEGALLATLPNAPTLFSPYGKNVEGLRSRQRALLNRMYDLRFITEQELEQALSVDIISSILPLKRNIVAPHFVFYVIAELEKNYSREQLETEGFSIYTTINLDLQNAGEEAVSDGAKKNIARGATNAGLVALDAKTGEVLVMVGSKDYFDESVDGNVNITIRERQPGSAFKPFAYAKAFEKGFQPESIVIDRPINFGPDGSGRPYIPRNYDGKFHGVLTMRQALAMSLNVPAVQTLALAGVIDTIELATRLGITTLTDPSRYGLALVLGGAEVRPIDMASAFSVFSQEGMRHPLKSILKIVDKNNEEYVRIKDTESTRVLETDIAQKINSILSDNTSRTPIFGARSPLAFPSGVSVAAKTGTTQNFRDAWTVGYTPSIAVAVWAGNNDNHPMKAGADGIFVAAPIWRQFMNIALIHFPETGFTAYEKTALPEKNMLSSNTQKTMYFDKKTGREISPEKARKLKKNRVETRVIDIIPGEIALIQETPTPKKKK
ncbi:MAG: transglycosylase domain-containing protein [Candidatus Moranbacteria bacterium]|nr:transglycosylase domain-containing protein [Candidatus Moranbacteria bacterium]MDD3965064.1 transglycosylase domain-containing protein [Candidatus Moranbacteria bacterium]